VQEPKVQLVLMDLVLDQEMQDLKDRQETLVPQVATVHQEILVL
jgi:hypothetical protein